MKSILIAALLLMSAAAVKADENAAAAPKAEAPAAAPAKADPCKADIEKFCKDVTPGGGRIMACLKAYEDKLSEGCKAKGEAGRDKMDGFMGACKADLEKFCKDVKGGHGEKAHCLKEHEAEVSGTCKAKMEEARAEMAKRNPCMADMEKFCKDVKPGEGRIVACLKQHEADLSAGCKANKDKMAMPGRKGPGMRGPQGGRGEEGPAEEAPEGGPQGEPPAQQQGN